jgi:hypothetical protein
MDEDLDDVLIEDDVDEDEDVEEDFPDEDNVELSDLDSGFDATIPRPERDIDEDFEDDDTEEIDDQEPMTEEEEPETHIAAGEDEVELPLDVVLETGDTSESDE